VITVLAFLLTLGVLVVVHEYGHYRVAVACGVKVLRFSVGFGRVLWRRQKGRDATEFVVCALPLGGYVRMLDEREAPVPAHELDGAFNRKPLWARTAIVAAGPAGQPAAGGAAVRIGPPAGGGRTQGRDVDAGAHQPDGGRRPEGRRLGACLVG
jgi:membrane-associated protease RseP (regulator of RpoE activity)